MSIVVPLISRDLSSGIDDWQSALQAAMPDYTILPLAELNEDQREAAKVALVADPDPAELQRLPNLIWVQSLWAGVEGLVHDLPPSFELQIVKLADPQMARTMAEAVLAWTLYLHRDMPRYRQQQDARIWRPQRLPLPSERRICVLGLGHLGCAAARLLADHGFDVCGWSRSGRAVAGIDVFSGTEGLNTAIATAQIVVVLVPLTSQTRGMIGAETLRHMRSGASLINFARGPIIDDQALLSALNSGQVGHAVLDVFDTEPLPETSPYWTHPSVTVLPHISAPTHRGTASRIVADNLRRFFTEGVVPTPIDRRRGY